MEEIWKPVVGFEGLYEVSNRGNVRGLKRGKNRKTFIDKGGYIRLTLWVDSVQFNKRVHRMVGESFIPNPYNLPDINHKDFNKSNNNKENLEWCTDQENVLHAAKSGRYSGEKNGNVKLTEEDVKKIHKLSAMGIKPGIIAKKMFVAYRTVYVILNGIAWKYLHPKNAAA